MADPGHPALPLTADPVTGVINTVPQGSLPEVRQCARVVLRTLRGRRIEDPKLGIIDPRWGSGVDTDEIADALGRDEDRADWEVVADPVTGAAIGARVTGVL
jgi:hypothetical protein